MPPIRMAQFGTKHGHAGGKLLAMLTNPDVEFAGLYEPDPARRQELTAAGAPEGPFRNIHWFDSQDEMLQDPTIIAIASEGLNAESLDQTEAIVAAGKHVWYDKPAGDNWAQWQQIVANAHATGVYIQMGYMFRYHHGFRQVAEWVKSGLLGEIFSIRAHMSRWLEPAAREPISHHAGGIFYDLGGHMLDQIVWLLGRPTKITAFLRNDSGIIPAFQDNTLTVFEYDKAIAFVDIAAMEREPLARRFEVYGSEGSAIIMDPLEPAKFLRLCLGSRAGGYEAGLQWIEVERQTRQQLYELELAAFLRTINGQQPPDRPYHHELLVQETLLRATGKV